MSAVRDGDEYVLNGEKYYISGAGDPRCKIMIVMCKTNPDAAAHKQQSQILVPMDTPGVEIVGPMRVFGHDDAPHGHMHLRFADVRVPATTCCSARAAASRSARSVSARAGSITACGPSARARRRSR